MLIKSHVKKFTNSTVSMIPQPPNKIKSNLYKRAFPKNLIPFSSLKGHRLLSQTLQLGMADNFFPVIEQFQTQSHPSNCGPSTMVVNYNALGIDPLMRWKGYYFLTQSLEMVCRRNNRLPES